MESPDDHALTASHAISRAGATSHIVRFYQNDDFLHDAVARFLDEGSRGEEPLVIVASAPHRASIRERLASQGIDLSRPDAARQATFVDVSELLSTFMVGAEVDATRFKGVARDLLQKARQGREHPTLRVYSETVDLLWRTGNADAALRVEALWNEVAEGDSFSLLCAYAMDHFHDAAHTAQFEDICRHHTQALPTERYLAVPDEAARLRQVALLEQRAYSLATERALRTSTEQRLRQLLRDRDEYEAERTRLVAREAAAREAAETAGRLKDEFLAVISHELRTPLNAILGWSQIVNTPHGDATTVRRGLEVIQKNATLQLHLIENLLDMSHLITGKMVIEPIDVDLHEILEQAVETVRPASAAKGITLGRQFDPSARYIRGDPDRLRQIFWNLLSNAIRFTPPDGTIDLLLEYVDPNAQVVVRDSGQGITPEFLPFVFDRFRQADTGTSRSYGGLGVGLAMVRYLVEAHGGTVSAASPGERQGSTFTVKLPAAFGAAAGRPPAALPRAR